MNATRLDERRISVFPNDSIKLNLHVLTSHYEETFPYIPSLTRKVNMPCFPKYIMEQLEQTKDVKEAVKTVERKLCTVRASYDKTMDAWTVKIRFTRYSRGLLERAIIDSARQVIKNVRKGSATRTRVNASINPNSIPLTNEDGQSIATDYNCTVVNGEQMQHDIRYRFLLRRSIAQALNEPYNSRLHVLFDTQEMVKNSSERVIICDNVQNAKRYAESIKSFMLALMRSENDIQTGFYWDINARVVRSVPVNSTVEAEIDEGDGESFMSDERR